MKNELVIVLDFGGQYNQLVARRVRECNVYCEIYSYKIDIEKIKAMNPKGIILTGGPNSCYEPDSPTYSEELFKLGIPVLGLCYGAQLMSHVLGGKVEKADVREYGKTEVIIDKKDSKVFENVSATTTCWMSHFDYISQVAPGFEITAHTADCPVAAAENAAEKLYAIQFHPEVLHTPEGMSVDVSANGRWMHLLKIPSRKFVKKLGTEEYFLRFQVELIPLWQQDCFPEQSANSLPAYL